MRVVKLMNLFQEYKNIDVKRIAKYIKVNINRFRYIRLGMKGRNRHKVIAVGYAAAIGVAFILSLTNNNDVNASIAPTDSINYIMLENALDSSTEQASVPTIYPEKSIDNIKSLYEMVTVKEKEKTIEKELTVSKGDTFISPVSYTHLRAHET